MSFGDCLQAYDSVEIGHDIGVFEDKYVFYILKKDLKP